MFRVQDNVPEVYVNYSRDFQLFCRLYDVIFTGVRYSIDSMEYLTDSRRCNEETIELLQRKLGMFNSLNISAKEMSYLLDAFPYIIRNKGNIRAIEAVLRVFQRIAADPTITFSVNYSKFNENHLISIDVSGGIRYLDLIRGILNYVVPTGYGIAINEVSIDSMESTIYTKDDVEITYQPSNQVSTIIENNKNGKLDNTVGMTGVLNDKAEVYSISENNDVIEEES